jgi:hypothetical protein
MNRQCEEFFNELSPMAHEAQPDSPLGRHLMMCPECRNAVAALHALAAERARPLPKPASGAFERAMRAALRTEPSRQQKSRSSRVFWAGVSAGAALAASVVLAVLMLRPDIPHSPSSAPSAAVPQVALSLYQSRDVSIAMESPVSLENVEIRVLLSGSVDLAGFEGERELSWRTNLNSGMNTLTLPVVAHQVGSGQVLVEVVHQDRRRTFVVDVDARA